VANVEFLKENTDYKIKNFIFSTGPKNVHPVETFGLKFAINKKQISLIGDTAFYPRILDFYNSDILIINTVLYEHRSGVQHLCFEEAKHIISKLKPQKTILTHFGMSMLRAKPHLLVEDLKKELRLDIVAAYDGMSLIL